MTTVEDLERLQALIERLGPLGSVQRGEPIRAQDWNSLVGTVVEVARAVLGEGRNQSVSSHEHVDQVTLAWLDPKLRALLERGPLADPAAEARIASLERQVAALSAQIDRLQSGVTDVRNRVVDVKTNDLVRQNELTSLRRSFEGQADPREEILSMRQTLGSLQNEVRIAVEVSGRLTHNSQPIDVAGMVDRLEQVEQLRDRLTLPDGSLLDARGLENRLTQLTNTLVTEQELDDALKTRAVVVPQDQLDLLETKVRAGIKTDLDASNAQFADQLRGEVDNRLAGVDALVARAVGDALPGVQNATLEVFRPELAAAVQQGMADTQAVLERQLDAATNNVRSELGSRLDDLSSGVSTQVRKELSVQLRDQLEPIGKRVLQLEDQVDSVLIRIGDHGGRLTQLGSRIEVVARDSATADDTLQSSLLGELNRRDLANQQALDQRLLQLTLSTGTLIDSRISAASDSIVEASRQAAKETAASEVRIVTTQLRGEFRTIAQDEVSVANSTLRTTVTSEVTKAFEQVPGMVSREVLRSTADLPSLVRNEVDARIG